jgi:hypothetical protein
MNLEEENNYMLLKMDKAFREVLQLSSTKEVKACCNVAIKFLLANSINCTSKQESDKYYKFWINISEKINK